MTDAELFMKMRASFKEAEAFVEATADRVEAQAAEIERLRDALTKAVAMLDKTRLVLAEWEPYPFPVLAQVRATLAELTGAKP